MRKLAECQWTFIKSESEYFINPSREIWFRYSCPLKYYSRVKKYSQTQES